MMVYEDTAAISKIRVCGCSPGTLRSIGGYRKKQVSLYILVLDSTGPLSARKPFIFWGQPRRFSVLRLARGYHSWDSRRALGCGAHLHVPGEETICVSAPAAREQQEVQAGHVNRARTERRRNSSRSCHPQRSNEPAVCRGEDLFFLARRRTEFPLCPSQPSTEKNMMKTERWACLHLHNLSD